MKQMPNELPDIAELLAYRACLPPWQCGQVGAAAPEPDTPDALSPDALSPEALEHRRQQGAP